MRRNPNTASLTKEYIESKISPELIVSKYLGIDLETVLQCIRLNELIESPFRDDDPNPSCGIQYNNKGKLKIRDFGGIFWGDVYDLVAYVLTITYGRPVNVSNRNDFYLCLKHIAYTFRNIINGKEIDENHEKLLNNAIKHIKSQKSIIELVTRPWNKHDKQVWDKWKISLNYLNTHFVYAVDQYYINRNVNPQPKYYYNNEDPCYAYLLGVNRKGIYNIKLYFPNRNRTIEKKFITNCNCLEGIPNLELYDYDIIVLTKSSKDRLCLGNHLFNFPLRGCSDEQINVGIVNLPSESYKLKQIEYDFLIDKLHPKHGVLLSFMDFDRQGRECAKYLKDVYKIPYIFITNGQLGLASYGAKDFAELTECYSQQVIHEFIQETYDEIIKEIIEENGN